jgi:hypothetical protein
MNFTRAIALAGLLALSSAAPANAQDTATQQQGWVAWGSEFVSEALETLAYPFKQAWTMTWDAIGSADAEIAAEKVKFANKLKAELAAFSKDVSRTGFELSSVGISPDIIPEITLTLEVREPVSEAVEAELRKEFENSGKFGVVERTILLALLDLDEAAAELKVEGYQFSEVEMELVAIFPEVTLNFEREEADAADPATAPKTDDGTTKALSN